MWKLRNSVAWGCCGILVIGIVVMICLGEPEKKGGDSLKLVDVFTDIMKRATSAKCFYAGWNDLDERPPSEADLLTRKFDYCVIVNRPLFLTIQLRDHFKQYPERKAKTQTYHNYRLAVVFFQGESEIGRIVYPKDQPVTVINGQAYERDFDLMMIILRLLPQEAYDGLMLTNTANMMCF